ncbi:MAG: CDP-archaeol synthase [Candidatus Woesearchaeota archaeon]|nr:CDP-archaeol synthase [Candidatus Woesearchaeota archaeon]
MQNLIDLILTTVTFFLPAGVANMMPVLVAKIPVLNVPMDFGYSFRGKRIFGDHKTWRGLVFGIGGAVLISYFIWRVPMEPGSVAVEISVRNSIILGIALGAGALLGDAIKSFFKRQIGIKPGGSWVPFDQIDWILGALIAVHFFVAPQPVAVWITTLVLFGLLHPVINVGGYLLKIKKNKF